MRTKLSTKSVTVVVDTRLRGLTAKELLRLQQNHSNFLQFEIDRRLVREARAMRKAGVVVPPWPDFLVAADAAEESLRSCRDAPV